MRKLIALLAGLIFGLGMVVSDMINPARVLGFLDLFGGAWDPTLAFVMGGAVVVMAAAWLLAGTRQTAVFGGDMPGAASSIIDRQADRRRSHIRPWLGPGGAVPRTGPGRYAGGWFAGADLHCRDDLRHGAAQFAQQGLISCLCTTWPVKCCYRRKSDSIEHHVSGVHCAILGKVCRPQVHAAMAAMMASNEYPSLLVPSAMAVELAASRFRA